MIAEDLLERGLADAASAYDVPPDAVERIREQLAPSVDDEDGVRRWYLHGPSKRGWLVLSAAAVVLVVIVSFAIGGAAPKVNHVDQFSGTASPARAPAIPGESANGGTSTSSNSDELSEPLASPVPVPQKEAHRALAPNRPAVAASGSVAGGTAATGSDTPTFDSGRLAPPPSAPDKVIKTGELDLQVSKGQVSTTLDKLTGLATLMRGYVADSRSSEGGFAPSGQVTIRVPVASFEETVSRARKLPGVKVLALQTSGKDVTSKFVDLKARISALEKTRQTFLTLLAKATTIGETLAVQQHVTDVQTQIEQLQGQKKVLVNRAALSTLTVTVDQKFVAQTKERHEKSGLHKAFDRSVSRFVHGIEAIIGIIGPLLLVALIVGLAWLAARFGYRRVRRRMV